MANTKFIGEELAAQSFPEGAITMAGIDYTIADDGTADTEITGTGSVVVTVGGESAVLNLHQASDASVIDKSFGSATISDTLDNDTTVNVYVATGVVTIQNKTGESVTVNIKAYI